MTGDLVIDDSPVSIDFPLFRRILQWCLGRPYNPSESGLTPAGTTRSNRVRRGKCETMTPEEQKAYNARHYLEHRDAIRLQQKQYSEKHRAEKAAYDVVYGQVHHEEKLERERRRYQNKRGHFAQYQREYYLTHKGKVGDRVVEWRKDHPENMRVMSENRRLRIIASREVSDVLTLQEWNEILEQYHHRCAYCGCKLDKPTMDHVIPLSKGGKHTKGNVVPACLHCNSSKKDRTPEEWFGLRGE